MGYTWCVQFLNSLRNLWRYFHQSKCRKKLTKIHPKTFKSAEAAAFQCLPAENCQLQAEAILYARSALEAWPFKKSDLSSIEVYQLNVCQKTESLDWKHVCFWSLQTKRPVLLQKAFHLILTDLFFPNDSGALRGVVPMAVSELQDVLALKLHERIWAQDRPCFYHHNFLVGEGLTRRWWCSKHCEFFIHQMGCLNKVFELLTWQDETVPHLYSQKPCCWQSLLGLKNPKKHPFW